VYTLPKVGIASRVSALAEIDFRHKERPGKRCRIPIHSKIMIGSQETDHLPFSVSIPFDVSLSRGKRAMPREFLDIAKRSAGLRDLLGAIGDKGPPAGMRASTGQPEFGKPRVKPHGHRICRVTPSPGRIDHRQFGAATIPRHRHLPQAGKRLASSGCIGMVRPPRFPLLARFCKEITSASSPPASVTMAQLSPAISFARRLRSQTGERCSARHD
jgi:hypothetical protein